MKFLFAFMLFSSIAYSQNYGIAEIYYDTPTKQPVVAFYHSQSIVDTSLIWSSSSWYWNMQLDSKQWVQYWFLSNVGIGIEVETWKSFEEPNLPLYVMPRIGMQLKFW